MYDRYGSSFQSAGPGRGPQHSQPFPGGGAGFEEFDFSQLFGGRGSEGFADIFKQFSGGRARGRRGTPQRGSDLQHELEIPFRTAILGGEMALQVRRPNGKTESITVKVPAGIEDGKKIRLREQGEADPAGGPAGDLLITVHVASHPFFQRRQNDLIVTVPVTLAEAALGAKVDVPTPKGTLTLTVPAGSSGGRRLRVKGHGVAPSKGPAGDLFAELRIILPKQYDEEAMEQVRAWTRNIPCIHERSCNGDTDRSCGDDAGRELACAGSAVTRIAPSFGGTSQIGGRVNSVDDRWRNAGVVVVAVVADRGRSLHRDDERMAERTQWTDHDDWAASPLAQRPECKATRTSRGPLRWLHTTLPFVPPIVSAAKPTSTVFINSSTMRPMPCWWCRVRQTACPEPDWACRFRGGWAMPCYGIVGNA